MLVVCDFTGKAGFIGMITVFVKLLFVDVTCRFASQQSVLCLLRSVLRRE